MELDAYLYGMTVLSSIHRLASALPRGDGYAEILETRVCPGGETMNAAMVLSGLGLKTAIGGPHWGSDTRAALASYAERYQIDVSAITTDLGYAGVQDLVLVAGGQRTVLGTFGRYFRERPARWSAPDRAAIESAQVVAIDPYFGESSELAAELATRAGKPFITIDCAFDHPLHARAAATVISREYRSQHYSSVADEELLARYVNAGGGLTILTSGKEAIRYARLGSPARTILPPVVPAISTLGAGDTFRAGVVYGVLRGWSDGKCVQFAAGLAALMCTRFPIADNVPTLAEVEAFLSERERALRS
jgi:sugar/nucleoside kinase (ribokinase family)